MHFARSTRLDHSIANFQADPDSYCTAGLYRALKHDDRPDPLFRNKPTNEPSHFKVDVGLGREFTLANVINVLAMGMLEHFC